MGSLRLMRPAVASPLLVALLAPVAGAHAIPADLAIAARPTPLPFDDEEPASLAVTFDYKCTGLASGNITTPMSVRFDLVDPPSWLVARLEPAAIEPLLECDGIGRATTTLFAAARRNASAPMPSALTVRAAWTTEGYLLNVTAQTNISAPWIAAFEVNATTREATDRPQTPVVFPLTLKNLGNGVTRFTFEIVDKSPDLVVPVPQPITLQPVGGHSSATVPFTVMTPYHNGKVDADGTVTLRITPQVPLDPRVKGEPQEITLTIHTRGWYVPGPELLAALTVLALVATLRARRGR